MVSGTSVRVQVMSDRCFEGARAYQSSVASNAVNIAQEIKQSGREVGSPMKVRMELEGDQALAVEETAKARFPLGPFPPPIRRA